MKHSEYLRIKLLLCLFSVLHKYCTRKNSAPWHLLNELYRKMRQIDSETGVGSQHGGRQPSVNVPTANNGAEMQKPEPTMGVAGGGGEADSENSTPTSIAQESEHMGGQRSWYILNVNKPQFSTHIPFQANDLLTIFTQGSSIWVNVLQWGL